jgi:hypothetical protein
MDAVLHKHAGKWRGKLQQLSQVIDGAKVQGFRDIVQQRELAVIQPDSRQIKTAFQREQLQLSYFAIRGPFGQRLQIQGSLPAYHDRRSPLKASSRGLLVTQGSVKREWSLLFVVQV